MKLISYQPLAHSQLEWSTGIYTDHGIIDLATSSIRAPQKMQQLLEDWEKWQMELNLLAFEKEHHIALEEVRLGPPLPRPASFRDFYAFETHVRTCRQKRGLEMVPEWYQFPVFYFSNPAVMTGTGQRIMKPNSTRELDYELEVACILGKGGVNIPVEEADSYIAGFCILNDWSARDVQREEVKVGLGPAKGKDFATSMGPYLVTSDELADVRISDEKGDRYDLTMIARVNGREYSRGNLADITFTFAQMIARASEDCPLYPGDVIGSGTVGSGCILELGGEEYGWLQPGDVVELEVERLGVLCNRISE
ncbi:fumarylacetoacetate hydrolase family protein [Brevibacillus ginsengisoli]|uniref:fumarylacetoacetate hydrolase family protein n=1 Tax=Brevibacillus ginsengisoli TaxID=363854 RepID=UPI003CED9270